MSDDSKLPELDYVRELAQIFQQYELDEIELETGEQRVLLRRGDMPVVASAAPAPLPAAVPSPGAVAAPVASAPVPQVNETAPVGDFITSPFVGTFYRSARPEVPPFVDVGAKLSAGATVCVVEAMKLFNEIEVEFPCVVEEILVENAEAVEFGTKLFRVRKL